MATYDSRSFYTRGDSFSVGASREHIERSLLDFGATDVLFSQRGHLNAISFRACGRQFRIVLSLPQNEGSPTVPGGLSDVPGREVTAKVLELDARRFWHAFALSTDAKLAAAAAGVATLESEFLAHVVLPGNHTVMDELEPVIASAYRSGQRPCISTAAGPRTD
ncbi:hypothetical protein [Pseudarthrobacter sp. LT1]|uniref:hypothetical protein n=1 Tax=Pseudarthrobacter sp. LT1 TaxID=3111450 RepID=UPI002D794F58|nr:hypothetical protein [Pseudarthrobacter sp. LT1]WRT13002.1 hypothetical protein VIK36_16835 [Pseudarthrobacter sp. LT1]